MWAGCRVFWETADEISNVMGGNAGNHISTCNQNCKKPQEASEQRADLIPL